MEHFANKSKIKKMHEKLRIISGREEYESMSKDEKVCQKVFEIFGQSKLIKYP